MQLSKFLTLVALVAGRVEAHPGHDLTEEFMERRSFVNSVSQVSLSHCADKLRARGVEDRNVARRAAALEAARARRGLLERDLDSLDKSHDMSDLGYTEDTSASTLFSSNGSCVLTPEVTQGPYYVGGEYVRKDVTDGQAGLDITLDYQVIDVDTCEPVPEVYLEMWHCNATGVYSGVVSSGNGDTSDTSNLDKTFLRGIQPTDEDGVAQFQSIFPGHYVGRATHIHIMSSHVGQAFFDQDLIEAVDSLEPYTSNTGELTTNEEDSILSEEAVDVDPFFYYTYLGNSLSDGLFAWVAFGINTSSISHVTPASFLYESGGVANSDSGMGGGPGGPGGPGDAPSGAPPNGINATMIIPSTSSSGLLTPTPTPTPNSAGSVKLLGVLF
ncbi:putative extracellular dioxygenase [Stachybotrys elegans]|uniref:Extracellular dioxygenase n=1 Tax=Stachybotrys elegans TaxID=80388 RepID=A0A8K0SR94_9HYPO|nr:putative extracellular dioxygenase [Stachybotrys elegans]